MNRKAEGGEGGNKEKKSAYVGCCGLLPSGADMRNQANNAWCKKKAVGTSNHCTKCIMRYRPYNGSDYYV